MEKKDQKERTILVTGANRGLGFGFCETLCSPEYDYYKVILTARDTGKGEKAVKKILEKYSEAKDRLFFH